MLGDRSAVIRGRPTSDLAALGDYIAAVRERSTSVDTMSSWVPQSVILVAAFC